MRRFIPAILLFALNGPIHCYSQKSKTHPIHYDSSLHLNSWRKIKTASDEFENGILDTFKWARHLWYDVSGDFAFKTDNILVKDGNLQLIARKEIFNNKEFTIGAVESKFELPQQPSLLRVRAKLLPDSANVCSAIWLQSSPEVKNNPNPEIDIIEYFQKTEMHMNLFTWNKNDSGNYEHVDFNGQVFDYKKDLSRDYHIYGLERTNISLRFYFDDRLVCEWRSPDSAFLIMPRHVVLSLEGHRYIPNTKQLPAAFLIDWVRIYNKPSR